MCIVYNTPTLCHLESSDGRVIAKVPNQAVSTSLLKEILGWKLQGGTTTDIAEYYKELYDFTVNRYVI